MSNAIDVLNLISIKCDLSVPQSLFVGYIGNVEKETKSVVIFEAVVYVAFCVTRKRRNYYKFIFFNKFLLLFYFKKMSIVGKK